MKNLNEWSAAEKKVIAKIDKFLDGKGFRDYTKPVVQKSLDVGDWNSEGICKKAGLNAKEMQMVIDMNGEFGGDLKTVSGADADSLAGGFLEDAEDQLNESTILSYPEIVAEGMKRTIFKEQLITESGVADFVKSDWDIEYEDDADGWKSWGNHKSLPNALKDFEKAVKDLNRGSRANVFLRLEGETLISFIIAGAGTGEGIEFDASAESTMYSFLKDFSKWVEGHAKLEQEASKGGDSKALLKKYKNLEWSKWFKKYQKYDEFFADVISDFFGSMSHISDNELEDLVP